MINIPIHISTQYSTVNYEAVKFWKDMGVERVVLGRELSREEIIDILNAKDRTKAGKTANPEGLHLNNVFY